MGGVSRSSGGRGGLAELGAGHTGTRVVRASVLVAALLHAYAVAKDTNGSSVGETAARSTGRGREGQGVGARADISWVAWLCGLLCSHAGLWLLEDLAPHCHGDSSDTGAALTRRERSPFLSCCVHPNLLAW